MNFVLLFQNLIQYLFSICDKIIGDCQQWVVLYSSVSAMVWIRQ